MKLNLGCSNRHLANFINCDLCQPADQIVNLELDWPWPDSTVDYILAHDIFEHLTNPIHTMNEAWRVLRPGGRADIIVPTTDGRGWAQDPTHRCIPPFNRNSFFYYTNGDIHYLRFHKAYGINGCFNVISEEHEQCLDQVIKLHILLEAVKP
jgi:SAM-dependent methyltransferase